MQLPNLPQQHKQREATSSIDLKHIVERCKPETCSLEEKHTRGKDYLLYSEVKPEQIAFALSISSDKGAWIRTLGQQGEPDHVWLKNEPAFIVIKYPKGIVWITIGNFLFEKEKSKRKSLTWERAKEIATKKENT
jgi:hypothetical protein